MHFTSGLFTGKVRTSSRDATSQQETMLSEPPANTSLPSGLRATL